jgi:protein SCO1/2
LAIVVKEMELVPPGEVPPNRSHRGAIIGIAVAAVLLVGASAIAGFASRSHPQAWQGTVLEPAPTKPDFTLTDTSGHPYDFQARTKGQLTFLYFGYTHCPDVCPITLATLSGALGNLPGVAATVVFVTTDPARDTPARLRSWLDGYDTHYVGLTGTPAQLAAAQRAAGVTVATADAPSKDGSYTVGHAASVLVYTPDSREHLTFPFGITQGGWQHDIPKMLSVAAWNR